MFLYDYYYNFNRHHLTVCGCDLVRGFKYDLLVSGLEVPGKLEVYNGDVFVLFSFVSSDFRIADYELDVVGYDV